MFAALRAASVGIVLSVTLVNFARGQAPGTFTPGPASPINAPVPGPASAPAIDSGGQAWRAPATSGFGNAPGAFTIPAQAPATIGRVTPAAAVTPAAPR